MDAIVRALRIILITAILAVAPTPASAWSGKLGLQVLGVGNSLTGELPDEGNWRGRQGLGAGLVAELNLAADVSLSLQPTFVPRRSRQEFESRGEVIAAVDYDLEYLSVPLVVRVTGEPLGTRGFVTAGLDLGFLLDASFDAGSGPQDLSEQLRSTSLGALFGAGAMIPVGRQLVVLELRYVQGLDDIVKRAGRFPDAGLTSPSVKYRGIQAIAAFAFKLGGG